MNTALSNQEQTFVFFITRPRRKKLKTITERFKKDIYYFIVTKYHTIKMGKALNTGLILGMAGLAGLASLVGGCSNTPKTRAPQAQVQTLTKEARLQEIKRLAQERADESRKLHASGNKNLAIYKTGLLGDEINDSLKNLGYAELVSNVDGGYVCTLNEAGEKLMKANPTFAKNYSILTAYGPDQRGAAYDAMDGE
jgi:hypothetical protein